MRIGGEESIWFKLALDQQKLDSNLRHTMHSNGIYGAVKMLVIKCLSVLNQFLTRARRLHCRRACRKMSTCGLITSELRVQLVRDVGVLCCLFFKKKQQQAIGCFRIIMLP